MKSSIELQQDRNILADALNECRQLVASHSTRSTSLARMTSAHALGNATHADLSRASHALDETVDAITRRASLEQALVALDEDIAYAKGVERRAMCVSVQEEFDTARQQAIALSKQLLDTYRTMHKLSIRHQGLTDRPLMNGIDYTFHLPALVVSQFDDINIRTGQQLAQENAQ